MPTILQINTVANIGSTGRIVEKIGQLIIGLGWTSYIAYGRRAGESKSNLIQIGNKREIYAHYVGSRLFDHHGLYSQRATKNLISTIDSIHPDIIHLHNITGYYINYPILFKYLSKIDTPVIWTLHDCWPMTGHCTYYSAVNCNKWQSTCYNCPRLDTYPESLIDRSKYNFELKKQLFNSIKNMTIVPVSNWLGGEVEKSFLKNYPIHVIQNGIDLKTFYPRNGVEERIREKYRLNNKFIIISVAYCWNRNTGFYDFLKLREILDDNYEIVLVGVTERQKKRLPKGITGISRTNSKDELAELYTTADIAVTPQVEATFGLVTAEAMACGTPVIVYNTTACPEVVSDDSGFIIPPKDINAMAKAIMDYNNSNNKDSYKKNCLEQVARFDENERYGEYIQLYKSLIK